MGSRLIKRSVSLLLCAAILIASTVSLSFTAFAAEDDEEEFPEAAKIVINTEFGNGTTLLKGRLRKRTSRDHRRRRLGFV